ncbi:AcrB/AcrD/AcrF family protein [Elizabethkingia anophelis]|jgi:HAE1 family hydrophobic/amphiphilic exporter-1|uniref:HAE1 family hydrophobic/amphiphilic exporter-1 n=2 Tax=Bacteroidota TaxID=976 RepID=A0A318U917_9SPHI|nr:MULTISPECIES: efflux RND transporter permease subunit [Bacteroidota]MDV2466330.1 AcrB/AcrD/AcrF family protein [Elizabethkingia anophelis]OJV56427.1 MAG: acriflavin resistance protein [Bacteroidetes bacterium 43-16]MDV3725035.1 AcrB/AcrD/AcrF family protein [Elizabethkingia anophelis]MDV3730556.1 AcrB/AcrD/AcrF family protein [Elizabethkingia anophelis]MDV3745440.1 AcrB/AcrD/AcrF family protein [Elizabethkingia anophelis]
MNITEISIKRPSLIIVLFSVFALLGIIGYKNLSYELMPDFNQPVVVIKTVYPGAEPNEVETSVSRKIEDALSNLEGVDYLLTKSLPNASIIIANLKYGTDLDKTMQDAQRYIDNIRKDLPNDIQNPVMSKVSPNDLPIMSVSATSNLEPTDFYQKMKDDYLPQIQQLKGVAEIAILGGEEREIQIKVDKEKLKLYKISLYQVVEAVNRSGIDLPAGKLQTDTENNSVRLVGKFNTINDIQNVQVAMPFPNSPVYVKDIAEVTDGIKEITSYSRYNSKNGIGLMIKKQGDANAVDVSKLIREKFQSIEKQNANADVKFVVTDDSTDNTIAAVNSVVFDLILAVILVSLVMLLFLRSFRNSLIVLVAIPTSLITAFAVMWLWGYTLNLMTLLAMSLIIGILVDDATVVLENIQRHLDMGKEKRTAAMDGRMEIGFSALSITLVDVVVFLPILFLQVFVADMLKQFSVVVITSTLTSLLVGFTLTPWLASRIGKKEDLQPTNFFNRFLLWFEHQLDQFINWYGRTLNWVLHHKLIFTGFVLLLFVGTVAMMKQGIIGKELISTGDQGKFRLALEFDKSTSIQQNNLVSEKIENYILKQPEVSTVFSNVGGPSTGIGSLGVGSANKTEFTIQLKSRKETNNLSTETFMRKLRTDLQKEYSGINFSMIALGLIPRSAPIEITLSGSDLDQVMQTGNDLKTVIEKIPGADNVRLSVEAGSPELKVIPDKDKMQRLGLNTAYVGMNLRTAFTGNDDATLTENGTEYPVRIWLDKFSRKNYDDVNQLNIINPMGIPIEVSQFATIERDNSPSLLERKDRQPAVTLTSDALGRPSGTVADDVVAYLKNNPLPNGIQMTWGSDIKRQNDSFGALGSVLLISFLLIYLIMVALYDSYIYPFVALFAIPVAAIGAFLALNLSLSNLSLFALLGLIMLMGLVTKNSILIVDFTNHLKAEGKHYQEALITAGKERMRPILMTTLSMAIGMLPIALASGTAAEWKNGLAWVIIGGLLSSLALTVYLVPMVYYGVDRMKEKLGSNKKQ